MYRQPVPLQIGENKSKITKVSKPVSQVSTNSLSKSNAFLKSSKLSLDMKNVVLHGSMEDIHRPKNFRCSGTQSNARKKSKKSLVTDSTSSRTPEEEAENHTLYKYIEDEKREILLRKACMTFLYGALKKRSQEVVNLIKALEFRREECASRLILRTLLLNSWRKDKIRLTKLTNENAQLTISVENLGLQLRVLRHLQATEKDRLCEKTNEIKFLKNQVSSYQKSLKNNEADLESTQEEFRYIREDNEKLVQQKIFFEKELQDFRGQKEELIKAVESEKKRANRAEDECRTAKNEYTDLRKQVKELSNQSSQWQDYTRKFESKGIQMSQDIKLRETSLKVMESNFKILINELAQYKLKKVLLQEAYETSEVKLTDETAKNELMMKNLTNSATTAELQKRKLISLEESILQLQFQNHEMQEELYGYKLKNVRNRRAWVHGVSCIYNPAKLIKYLIYGPDIDYSKIMK